MKEEGEGGIVAALHWALMCIVLLESRSDLVEDERVGHSLAKQ